MRAVTAAPDHSGKLLGKMHERPEIGADFTTLSGLLQVSSLSGRDNATSTIHL